MVSVPSTPNTGSEAKNDGKSGRVAMYRSRVGHRARGEQSVYSLPRPSLSDSVAGSMPALRTNGWSSCHALVEGALPVLRRDQHDQGVSLTFMLTLLISLMFSANGRERCSATRSASA